MPYTKKLLELQTKAEKRGEIQQNPEANQFTVKGVQEGTRLHQVFTYPAPKGAPLKQDYDVFVQPRGGKEWTKVDLSEMGSMDALDLYLTSSRADFPLYCCLDDMGYHYIEIYQ